MKIAAILAMGLMGLTLAQTKAQTTDISGMDNVVYIENTSVNTHGEKTEITASVMMNNTDVICGFEFNLVLPDGVTVPKDDDCYMIELSTERTTARNHNIFDSALKPDGSIYVLCNSTRSKTFSGNSGEVATITFCVEGDIPTGISNVTLRNQVITRSNASTIKPGDITSAITVTAPQPLNSYGYTTFSCNADMKISGGTAYTAVVDGTDIVCSPITDGIIPAYTGVLICSDNADGISFSPATSTATLGANHLLPTTTQEGLAEVPGTGYVYVLNDNKFCHFVGTKFTINKAYFNLSSTPAARMNIIIDEGTGIDAVRVDESSTAVYDMQGRKLRAPQTGLYIINGQAKFVK